ncbi:MAG: PAS domain-containing protein, partial [Rhodobacterales bacterium]
MSFTPQSVIDALPLPAVMIRRDERIEGANEAAHRLLGEGIRGRHFITALRQPALLDAIEATLRDGKPRQSRYLTNDGRQDTTFQVSCRAVPLAQGPGALVVFEDVTHLEQAVQTFRQ